MPSSRIAARRLRRRDGRAARPQDSPTQAAEAIWAHALGELDGLPGGGVNMGYEAVDRQVRLGHGTQPAVRWLRRDGSREQLSYDDLATLSSRVAESLHRLGLTRAQCVATLLPPRPELFATLIGTVKAGLVACAIGVGLDADEVRERLRVAEAAVLVTSADLFAAAVRDLRADLPHLRAVIVVGDGSAGCETWESFLEDTSGTQPVAATGPEEPALLIFTGGTTGPAKATLHCHAAIAAQRYSAAIALGVRRRDVFWCTADPGSLAGVVYGVFAPLACGATVVADEGEFSVERCYDVLEAERVAIWYTCPGSIRLLMRAHPRSFGGRRLPFLRHLASGGEALEPAALQWTERTMRLPIHDTWWQAETGAIMTSNVPYKPVRPGSMGRAIPGIELAVLARGTDGRASRTGGQVHVLDNPDQVGELAVRVPWPSMFRGYRGDPDRYERSFADGWYLTGDLARIDRSGDVWFASRREDVIDSRGQLIDPAEVERVIKAHSAVIDAAAFGRPDPIAGDIVAVQVVLRPGVPADAATRRSIMADAQLRLGRTAAPREIEFVTDLPRSTSGRLLRRALRSVDPSSPATT